MKIIMVILIFIFSCSNSQDLKKDVPVLISVEGDTSFIKGKLILADKKINDSILGRVSVVVNFIKELSYDEPPQIEDVKIATMEMTSLKDGLKDSIKISYSIFGSETKLNTFEKEIFDKYSEIFIYYYKNQPYSLLKGREGYDVEKIQFSCPFVIIPGKYRDGKTHPYIKIEE